MMINFLERVFKKTMRTYWWEARRTGKRYALDSVKALIYAEIRVLNKNATDNATKQRINELLFILTQIKKVENNEHR
jgi:hypothetical protein